MELTQVLIKPLVSEKNTALREVVNERVVFMVHPDANKAEISRAVETVFGVKVEVLDEFFHSEAHAKQFLSSLSGIEASLFDLGVDDFVQKLHSTLEFHNKCPP